MQKHLTLTGHVYSPALFLMTKDLWDGLSVLTSRRSSRLQGGVKANRARIDRTRRAPWQTSCKRHAGRRQG